MADKSIPHSILTKRGLYLALHPSYHTAPMLKVDGLTAGSETRRQEKRGRQRAKAESGSASRHVKLDEIFLSVSESQSWLIIPIYGILLLLYLFLSKPQATFLTNKGESLGIWQSKVFIERIGWVQWETDCRFYETTLSRNRVDPDKCNWIGMSLYFTWEKGWLTARLLSSNIACFCIFVWEE